MMPSYLLYQIKMSDKQLDIEELRTIQFKTMTMAKGKAQRRVDAANACNLYKLVALIAADDLEEAFNMGNGYPVNKNSRIEKFRPAFSMSVGDVLIDIVAEKAYACCSTGWETIHFEPSAYVA